MNLMFWKKKTAAEDSQERLDTDGRSAGAKAKLIALKLRRHKHPDEGEDQAGAATPENTSATSNDKSNTEVLKKPGLISRLIEELKEEIADLPFFRKTPDPEVAPAIENTRAIKTPIASAPAPENIPGATPVAEQTQAEVVPAPIEPTPAAAPETEPEDVPVAEQVPTETAPTSPVAAPENTPEVVTVVEQAPAAPTPEATPETAPVAEQVPTEAAPTPPAAVPENVAEAVPVVEQALAEATSAPAAPAPEATQETAPAAEKAPAEATSSPASAPDAKPDSEVPEKLALLARIKLGLIAFIRRFQKTPVPATEKDQDKDSQGSKSESGEAAAPAKPWLITRMWARLIAFLTSYKKTFIASVAVLLLAEIGYATWDIILPPPQRSPVTHTMPRSSNFQLIPDPVKPEFDVARPQIEALKKKNEELQAEIETLQRKRRSDSSEDSENGGTSGSKDPSELTVGSNDPKSDATSLRDAIRMMNGKSGGYATKPAPAASPKKENP